MEYRNTEYRVVQTANLTGWKWTAIVAGERIRTGSAYNRVIAVALAQRAVDKLLKSGTNKIVGPSQSIEGQ
jgi:macrodomain Ter protein organizer (MatP/YcbG family)